MSVVLSSRPPLPQALLPASDDGLRTTFWYISKTSWDFLSSSWLDIETTPEELEDVLEDSETSGESGEDTANKNNILKFKFCNALVIGESGFLKQDIGNYSF